MVLIGRDRLSKCTLTDAESHARVFETQVTYGQIISVSNLAAPHQRTFSKFGGPGGSSDHREDSTHCRAVMHIRV